MIPVLYPATETSFTTNGLGGLPDAISCVVTEQRNTQGGYYLEMEYPIDGIHFDLLAPERIIYAAPSMGNTPQPFRISRITRPINGIVHIEAPHISAQLQKITTSGTFTARSFTGITYDFAEAARDLGQTFPFWFSSDKTFTESQISFPEPTPFMDVLLGAEGSILDMFGGEYEWNKREVILHDSRGVDSGLEIRYGVNMSDLEAETDATELVTACVPYWKGTVNEQDVVVMGDMCSADNASAYAYVRCVPLDVTEQFELEQDQQPTAAQVTAKGTAFINGTGRKQLQMSIRVKYEPTTNGIGERLINLCDTVRVVYPDLNVSSISKVVETRFNTLTEQYDELTIGSIRNNIVDTIAGLISGGAITGGGGSSGGGGGSAVGAVLYNMPQNLNEAQKAQARSNIGITGSGGEVEANFPIFTPQDFGAVADGVTDDTAAFNSALSLTDGGGTVYVPDGKYAIAGTILIPEWRLLSLGGSVELICTQSPESDSGWLPIIKMNRYARLKGNGSIIDCPYNYKGHALELATDSEVSNAVQNANTPYFNTNPAWKGMRDVDNIGILKRNGASNRNTTVSDVTNIGGDGVYIGVNYGSSEYQWGTKVDARVAGGFANGFHIERITGENRWMSDTHISGMVESAETGVLIERASGGVYCDVTIQPVRTYGGSETVRYAKNGIKIVSSANVDMSRSKVWDWNTNETMIDTLVDGEAIYRAYAMFGHCPGCVIHDFGMDNSLTPFYNRIYSDNIDNLISATIYGAKGRMTPPPKYVFYKNFRRASHNFNSRNVTWRDPINQVRYQMPFEPRNPDGYKGTLYRLGYFDFGDVENPVSGASDVLTRETVTIEENDYRGIYGFTNICFTETNANAYWNPIGFGVGGHVPIYYYSADGTRRYIYRLVRDHNDLQETYNCALAITNARRFVFDFGTIGTIGDLSAETYILLQPKYAYGAELYCAGQVAMQSGSPMICTESAVFGRDGSPDTQPTVEQLALIEDVEDAINASKYRELDYIESDGASYIDTGIEPTANTRITVRFKHKDSTTINSAERQYIFGTYASVNGTVESRLQFYYGGSQLASGSNFFIGWGSGGQSTSYTDTEGKGYRYFSNTPDANEHAASFAAGTFYFDNSEMMRFTNGIFTAPNSIYLFACHTPDGAQYLSNGLQIEAVSIYDGDTRIARFIPAMRESDGALGMFDQDGKQFHPNMGLGEFKNDTVTKDVFPVTLNADGTVNTFDADITYSAVAASVTNGKPKHLLVTWGNSLFVADSVEKLSGANGDVKFITDVEHDGIQRHMIFTLTSANALQTTLIETYARVPATVWEVQDVTQGLIALNTNISSSLAWQLTGLNLAPFKRIKVYVKAGRKTGSLSADSSITPASIIEMSMDDRAKEDVSQNVFIGSSVVQNPNDPNRLGIITCAVSGDKTKFAVVRATTLYGTAATSNTDAYPYVFKIEGYYD